MRADMSIKAIVISLLTIGIIFVLPHSALIPNFGYSIPILFIVWISLKISGENFSDIGFSLKRFEAKSILIGGLVATLTLAFMQCVFFPLLEFIVSFEDTDISLYGFIRENKFQYLFILIMGWLIGGLYEEIVFHGFIFTRLEKMIPGQYTSIISFIVTAAIFGGYHFQLGMDGLINAFLVGAVYLALFLYFKRNLWYSIMSHGIYNSMVMTLIYYGYL